MRLLAAIGFVFALSTSAMAVTYTQDVPDCTRNATFVKGIEKKGFEPVLVIADKLVKDKFSVFFNFKTRETMVLSASTEADKVCVISYGTTEINSTVDIEKLRNLFDSIIVDNTAGPKADSK